MKIQIDTKKAGLFLGAIVVIALIIYGCICQDGF